MTLMGISITNGPRGLPSAGLAEVRSAGMNACHLLFSQCKIQGKFRVVKFPKLHDRTSLNGVFCVHFEVKFNPVMLRRIA